MTNFRIGTRRLLRAGVMLGSAAFLSAQVMPPFREPDKQFTINSNVDMVLLDVSVKDSAGGFVSDLKKEDFKIYEDGKPQSVSAFTSFDTPVTVGLVVDNSGSMRFKRADTVTAAISFVRESNPQDEMFVVNFNDRVTLGLPDGMAFTDDTNTLRQALLNNPTAGQTALYDALYTALQHLDQGRRDKKTLVLVSDGGDNRSQHTLAEVIDLAQKSTATIYAIGIYDSDDKDANPGVLKKLAGLTGGIAYFPKQSSQIVENCRQIAKDIRNRYTLGYSVMNTSYDGKVRKLRVDASAPSHNKLLVRTRNSYIARPSKAPMATPVRQDSTITSTGKETPKPAAVDNNAPAPTVPAAPTATPRTDERPPDTGSNQNTSNTPPTTTASPAEDSSKSNSTDAVPPTTAAPVTPTPAPTSAETKPPQP